MRPTATTIALLTLVALTACSTPGPKRTVMAPKAAPADGSPGASIEENEEVVKVEVKETKLLMVLGTAGESGQVTDLFGPGSIDNQKLADALAADPGGVAVGSGGLGVRGTGRGGGVGIGTLGSGGGGGYGARRVRGRVQLGATSTSNLNDATVRAIFQRRSNQFRYCYEKALARNPKAGGVVEAELAVEANGRAKVTKANVTGSVDTAMLECVRRQLARVRFPKLTGGGTGTIKQALSFGVK